MTIQLLPPRQLPTHRLQGTGLVIEPGTISLEVGKTTKVSALLNQDGDIKSAICPPIGAVSVPEILTIDNNGNITALKPGNAQIKAESLGREAKALVTIVPASAAATTPTTPASPSTGIKSDDATSAELAKLRTIVIRPENEAAQPTLFKFSRLGEQRQFVAIGQDSLGQAISNLTFPGLPAMSQLPPSTAQVW